MSRARTFTKGEIMDAARAAAETGLRFVLHKTGEIEFSRDMKTNTRGETPEEALANLLKSRKHVA